MVEIDLGQVRATGTEHFPALADKYRAFALLVETAMTEHSPNGMRNTDYAGAWVEYATIVRLALATSERHLNDCGETLVELVDEFDLTDSEAADQIRYASESTLDIELRRKD